MVAYHNMVSLQNGVTRGGLRPPPKTTPLILGDINIDQSKITTDTYIAQYFN